MCKSGRVEGSHPLKDKDTNQAVRKGEPSLGSGSPSIPAIRPARKALPFEQQPRESTKAFAAFLVYLNLGAKRSLATVARQLAKSDQLIKRWSARFDWPGRVSAHVAHFAAVEREATEVLTRTKAAQWLTRREEHRDEEWAMRGELMLAGRTVLARFKDGAKGATLGDVARALDLASKLGRLASGMATDKTELTGEDGGPLRVELSAALAKVYGEVLDVEAVPVPALPEGEA